MGGLLHSVRNDGGFSFLHFSKNFILALSQPMHFQCIVIEFLFSKSIILEKVYIKIKLANEVTEKIENWKNWKTQNSIKGNPPKTEEDYWDFELMKIKNNLEPNCFYDELDVSFRHKAFQLALHYWEGEYLIKLESDLVDVNFDKKGIDAKAAMVRLIFNVLLCIKSTHQNSIKIAFRTILFSIQHFQKPLVFLYPFLIHLK